MSEPTIDDVDHIQLDKGRNVKEIWECTWAHNFNSVFDFRNQLKVYVRREFFDKTSAIPHRHHDIMAFYVVRRGRGTRVVNGFPHSMARGDVFLMAEDNIHLFDSASNLYIDAVYFHKTLWSQAEWMALRQRDSLERYLAPGVEGFEARGNTDYFGHLSSEPHRIVESIFDRMRLDFKAGDELLHLCVRNQFFNLLVQLAQWRESGLFTTQSARGAGIAEVLEFCDNNFDEPITIEQLAAMMHFSDAHFRRVFTQEVGMPPVAYLRRLRLQRAKTLLQDKTKSVEEIARTSGFDGGTQFGRAFKTVFGVSPLQFRQNPTLIAP